MLNFTFVRSFFDKTIIRWLLLGIIIGIVSGLGAALFFYGLQFTKHISFNLLAGYMPPHPQGEHLFESGANLQFNRWMFFLLPFIGGLISGLIVYRFAPEAEGHGTDAMIDAFHNKNGKIRARVPLVKSIATIFTLGFGGSAGREGPIAQIGAGFGSIVATFFKLSDRERRILLLSGCAAGLSAIFRAPLGGALTSIEVLYREDLETEALIPAIISSITAYVVFTLIFGSQPIFYFPEYNFTHPVELCFYIVLGLVCIPLGVFYVKIFYGIRDRVFRPLNIPRYCKPMIGGLGVGLLGIWLPQIYGDGWGWIQLAILGKLSIGIMALLAIAKIFATSFTISSGGSGGVFGPTLFIGGMIGGAIGFLSNYFFPGIITHPGAFVVVGMGAFFAGVANAPIGSLLMCSEMTAGYGLILPLMLVSIIAILFTKKYTIYEKQVLNRLQSPAHLGDFTINILDEMKIKDFYVPKQIPVVNRTMRYGELKGIFTKSVNDCFPVCDESGEIIGCINWHQARPIFFEQGLESLLVAQDFMTTPPATLSPDDSLYEALIKILNSEQREILIVNAANPTQVLGILSHEDLIHAYNREILRRKTGNKSER